MKGFTSFWAGAIAGYLVGSSKQGAKLRGDIQNLVHGLFGQSAQEEHQQKEQNKQAPERQESANSEHGSAGNQSNPPGGNSDQTDNNTKANADGKGLQPEQAQELAEKLGAKVSEPEGEEALPHAHPIHTSTSRLSA